MKALALAPVLALAALTFAAPPLAEAAHRHGRDCGHRGYSHSRDRHHHPIVSHHQYHGGFDYGRRPYASRYYGAYGYDDPVLYYDSGYYGYVPPPPPPPRVLRHRRHRVHVGLFLGF